MSNLRIIYDNAINSSDCTLTAGTTAGTLVASNMTLDKKSKVWRSDSVTTDDITATWAAAKQLTGVALPFCNLTSTSTIRVRAYTNSTDITPVYDTGTVLAVPYISLGTWAWGSQPMGVNAYSYGFSAYGRVWFNNTYTVKKIIITLTDTNNPSGYLEVNRIVTGSAWQPTYNTSFGLPVSIVDSSTHERAQSGDLITSIGNRFKKLTFDLNWLTPTDRVRLNQIIRQNGMTKPLFVSLFPNDPDVEKEQTYQIYGKIPQMSQLTHPIHSIYSSQIDIEEI